MDHFENVKIGQSIVVIDSTHQLWDYNLDNPQPPQYSGVPYKVIGIEFPFIMTQHVPSKNVSSIDVRECVFKIVSKGYAKAYNKACVDMLKKEEKKCPRCKNLMGIREIQTGQTVLICDNCSYIKTT